MTNRLPESARRHLQSQVVDAHPDAGLLTAFAEQSLTAKEREAILHHLAACAECRDVVALAAREEVPTGAPAAVAPSWFRSPMLHWAAVAATAVIVWAAVSVLAPRTTNRDVATRAELAQSVAEPHRDQAAPSAPSAIAAPMKKTVVASRRKPATRPPDHLEAQVAAQNQPTAAPAGERNAVAGVIADKEFAGVPAEPKQPTLTSRVALAPGAVGGMAQKDAAQFTYKTTPMAQISGTVIDATGAVVPNALVKITNSQTNTSTAVRTDSAGTYRTPVTPGIYSLEATSPGMQPVKTDEIKVDGTVAQNITLRPGAEAEIVEVTAAAAPSLPPPPVSSAPVAKAASAMKAKAADQGFAGLDGAETAQVTSLSQWRIAQDGSLEHFGSGSNWHKVEVVPGMTFRAVGEGGGVVWVGGADGTLFHGSDEGRAWRRVAVGPKNAPVSDSITAIAVPSAKSVVVTTSSGEKWSSSDGGHTWKRLSKPQ